MPACYQNDSENIKKRELIFKSPIWNLDMLWDQNVRATSQITISHRYAAIFLDWSSLSNDRKPAHSETVALFRQTEDRNLRLSNCVVFTKLRSGDLLEDVE